ncbi:MAG TPA: hypothetical protein VJL35_11230, partial [Gemmatimonadaceae bacterium]|nr:hypothetical protein [Gemmatimonadaceae bacterium]
DCTPDPGAWGFNCLFANSCFAVCSASEAAALVGVLGGAAGLVIGTVAGAVHGSHHWVKVPLPATSLPLEKPRGADEAQMPGTVSK